MKALKIIFLILFICNFNSYESNAQILKRLKNKLERATEDAVMDKAAEKAYQETGKLMDSLLEIDPDYQGKNQEYYQNLFVQGGADIPIEDIYKFDSNVMYKMDVMNNGKAVSMDYSMWFSDNGNYIATEMKNIGSEDEKNEQITMGMITILDDKNQAMIVIMESQKIIQIISMEKVNELATSEAKKNVDIVDIKSPKIVKSGKKKKILGYQCEEFTTQTIDGNMSFWITQEIELYQKNMFFNLSKSLGENSFKDIPNGAKGFMMEMHFENTSEGKNKGEKGTMVVTNISKKTKTINIKNYQKMNLGGFMKN